MFKRIPTGFIPDQDDDSVNIGLRAAQGTAFEEMAAGAQKVAAIVRENPNSQRAVVFVGNGPGGPGAMNTARVVMRMKPHDERPNTAQEIIAQLRPRLVNFPGFRTFITLPPAFQIGGRSGDNSYSVTLRSPDTAELYTWAGQFQTAVSSLASVQDVSTDLEIKSPRVRLTIDRDKAAALAVDPAQIQNALYSGFGPRWSSTIYGDTAQYRVLHELDPRFQEPVDTLERITFKAPAGQMVPLRVGAADAAGREPADHQPFGSAAGGRDFLRPAARRVARRSGRADSRSCRPRPAADDVGGIRGHGEGVRGVHAQPWSAPLRRDWCRLHRAGHVMRELHPPDHDSLGTAVRRGSARRY